ncbi:methyltransferase family protein [Actinoallomurus sp. CA-150999]|uniref:methyltransferase family protein n=1 Tax=Actinoallomurus sp. CA-150999 TaxID=3239887 RepID=UPI003D94BC64
MAVAALVLYLLWAALAFGLRGVIQRHRTGDAGFRGGGLRRGSVQWWARVLFIGALVVAPAGPVAELVGHDPIGLLDRTSVRTAGAVITVLGVAATMAAQWSMGVSWRVGVDETERTDLVTTGAFALARNPIFTAMIATAIGLVAMVPNLIAVAGLALAVVAIELQVRAVEEPYLHRVHGEHYRRYSASVGRFLPGIGRYRGLL